MPPFFGGGAFFLAGWAGAGFLARCGDSPSSSSGAAKMVPHLGHLTFLPAVTGLAGRSTVSHSGQINLEAAMSLRLDSTGRTILRSRGTIEDGLVLGNRA